MTYNRILPLATLATIALSYVSHGQTSPPSVLIITAHPDDEMFFAATVYKITHDLKGRVDLAVITNGEAGFKYSTLAEAYYGAELTDEQVGRSLLPTIRKRELMSGGKIIGIRSYFFLDQQDNAYTLNVDSVLRHVWDVKFIENTLHSLLERGSYDIVFVLLPTDETHGHHKGATILALDAVMRMPAERRPVVLAGSTSSSSDTVPLRYSGLDQYPVTSVSSGRSSFRFDRSTKFGFRDRLDYRIIVKWLIAEHKSQGAIHMSSNPADFEDFWWFDINDPSRLDDVRTLFERLAVVPYIKRTY